MQDGVPASRRRVVALSILAVFLVGSVGVVFLENGHSRRRVDLEENAVIVAQDALDDIKSPKVGLSPELKERIEERSMKLAQKDNDKIVAAQKEVALSQAQAAKKDGLSDALVSVRKSVLDSKKSPVDSEEDALKNLNFKEFSESSAFTKKDLARVRAEAAAAAAKNNAALESVNII